MKPESIKLGHNAKFNIISTDYIDKTGVLSDHQHRIGFQQSSVYKKYNKTSLKQIHNEKIFQKLKTKQFGKGQQINNQRHSALSLSQHQNPQQQFLNNSRIIGYFYGKRYRNNKFIMNNSLDQQIQQKNQHKNQFAFCEEQIDVKKVAFQKMKKIQNKIIRQIYQNKNKIQQNSQLTNLKKRQKNKRFKIFTNCVQSKKDIKRLLKQRRFINSTLDPTFQYAQPKLSPNSIFLSKSKDKLIESIYSEIDLNKKAKTFVTAVRRQTECRKEKIGLLRFQQEQKRKSQQILQNLSKIRQKQLSKQKRRIKALQNIKKRKIINSQHHQLSISTKQSQKIKNNIHQNKSQSSILSLKMRLKQERQSLIIKYKQIIQQENKLIKQITYKS